MGKTACLPGFLNGAAFSGEKTVLSLHLVYGWMLRRGRMESALLMCVYDSAYQSGARKRISARESIGK